jgi:hypothetical protein
MSLNVRGHPVPHLELHSILSPLTPEVHSTSPSLTPSLRHSALSPCHSITRLRRSVHCTFTPSLVLYFPLIHFHLSHLSHVAYSVLFFVLFFFHYFRYLCAQTFQTYILPSLARILSFPFRISC